MLSLASTSESQRRALDLPLRVCARDGLFKVLDCTPGWIAIRDARSFKESEVVRLTILFPFDGYDFSIRTEGVVRNISAADERTAFELRGLDDRQEALLEFVMDAAHQGKVFGHGEVLEVASQYSTAKPSRAEAGERHSFGERMRRSGRRLASGVAVIAILAGLSSYLWANVYDELYVVKAESAQVIAKTVNIASPAVGRIGFLSENRQLTLGEPLMTVKPAVGDPITVQSPCDCEQVDQAFVVGDFVKTGDPVLRLMRADAPLVVSAQVPSEKLMGLYGNVTARVRYADGHVVDNAPILWLPGKAVADANFPREESSVVLDPSRPLDRQMMGQPVDVSFDLFAHTALGGLVRSLTDLTARAETALRPHIAVSDAATGQNGAVRE